MGVTGLWRLLEPAGKPVPLETLENKILAIDISIWLHQVVKGYQDARGGSLANAHLIGLFQRLCKLLYYRIKPVFVFDGGCPALKKQTIMKRKSQKAQMHSDVDRVRRQLLEVLVKQKAVKNVLSEKKSSPTKKSPIKSANTTVEEEELFKLPPMASDGLETKEETSSDESEDEDGQRVDLHSLDVNSEYFKSLTPRERYDLLTELKETRKQNSWGRLHELPANSDNFSEYQMSRLLKRRQVQVSLEETEKEIGGHFLSLNELEVLLNEEGINTKIDNITTRRIASDENTRFVLITDVKEALESANKAKNEIEQNNSEPAPSTSKETDQNVTDELGDEFDDDLKAAIQLSLQCDPKEIENTESKEPKSSSVDLTFIGSEFVSVSDSDSEWTTDDSDVDSRKLAAAELALAKAYMLENSGLSEYEIMRILGSRIGKKKRYTKKKNISPTIKAAAVNSVNIPDLSEPKNIEVDQRNTVQNITNNSKVSLDESKHVLTTDKSIEIAQINPISLHDDTISLDSDSSFEEVPEASATNVIARIEPKPTVQLILQPKFELKDDIFADIFESKDQTSVKNTESRIEQLSDVSSMQQKVIRKEENIIEKNEVISTKEMIKISFEAKKIQEETINLEAALDAETLSTADESNEVRDHQLKNKSPQKGTRLSEIKNIVTQKDSQDTNKSESNAIEKPTLSTEELSSLADDLGIRREELERQQNKLDRMGRDISHEMTEDAQQLLRLFGIPYIIAPMEAEAQCAFLESIKLTDGTITDDSDIWLFGGRTVYKNFFDQQKHVLQFLSENIQNCFKLAREQLILLALLVGSDYTTGLSGVGPVTALEILAAFPNENKETKPPYITLLSGLKKFSSWWNSSCRILSHKGLRNKLKNISLHQGFPCYKVVEAYLNPTVESSQEEFSWGRPDLTALRDFTRNKFGWTQQKTDDILYPVLKRMDSKISQQSIRSFFRTDVKVNVANEKMSKRVKTAVDRIGGDIVDSDEGDLPSKPKKPRKASNTKLKTKQAKHGAEILTEPTATDETNNQTIEPSASSTNVDDSSSSKKEIPGGFPERYQETIPQRELDKNIMMKNKMKAIELFRTSRKGPGYIRKKRKPKLQPKQDAGLSESSSD